MITKISQGGRTVFLGKSEDALPYFTIMGYEMPSLINPADFFMDVIAGKYKFKVIIHGLLLLKTINALNLLLFRTTAFER